MNRWRTGDFREVVGVASASAEVASPLEHLCQAANNRMRIAAVLFLKTTIGYNLNFHNENRSLQRFDNRHRAIYLPFTPDRLL